MVATPCPLILAVPVALVAGLSRAAHFGVLIKGAGALETMARIRTLILDLVSGPLAGRFELRTFDNFRRSRPGRRRSVSAVSVKSSSLVVLASPLGADRAGMRAHVEYLASDALNGRMTGTDPGRA
mgnify:CR=1 FL=1